MHYRQHNDEERRTHRIQQRHREMDTIRLADLKSFTRFPSDKVEMTAQTYLNQSEREAGIMGVPENQLLSIIAFVLRYKSLS